jgi:hypothetical protein
MSQWKALLGRMTLFLGGPPAGLLSSALELYKQVWGGDPEIFQSNPNPLIPMVAQGKRDGLTVGCLTSPTRVDLNINPLTAPVGKEDLSFSLIEDTNQLHAELIRLITLIDGIVGSNSVSRVGLNLHFLTLAATIEEANKGLTRVMPEQYRPRITDEEDFVFQINRPRTSAKVEQVRMNYVTKWSMDRFKVLNISIPTGPAPGSTGIPLQRGRDFIAASVIIDNNNVPGAMLDSKQQSLLLYEALTAAEGTQREIGLNIEGF